MGARRYAEGTDVPVERSKAEIESLLRKHGATGFVSGWDDELGEQRIMCRIDGRMLRFTVTKPTPEDFVPEPGPGVPYDLSKRRRTGEKRAEQEHRRRWRAQLLVIKAKLEMIAAGEGSIDTEFLANVMLPSGETFGEWAAPQLEAAYEDGGMPPLLPSGGAG